MCIPGIHKRVTPELFHTTESLASKKKYLRDAIKEIVAKLEKPEKTRPVRMFRYRIKAMDYLVCQDDVNTRVKGKLTAEIVSGKGRVIGNLGKEILVRRKHRKRTNGS
jgi:hypothetical protein